MRIKLDSKQVFLEFKHCYTEYSKPVSTIVSLVDTEGKLLAKGESHCHPGDQFNRSVGRKLALERLAGDFPREQRRQIWNQYWKEVKTK